jgi:hypothetical protein
MPALRKERCSFTLSHDSVEYLTQEQRQRKAASASAALEEILRERQRETKQRLLDAQISAYYDSIPDEQQAEDRAWGAFGESQIAAN